MAQDFRVIFDKLVSERGNYIPADIVDFSATNFYDGRETCIIATKTESELEDSRIEYYREQIRNGKGDNIL
ncbi:hypothetical protein GCM10022217_25270 [Chryseobacterium ginsenosidimutans]